MPWIYSTNELKEEYAAIVAKHPDAVVLLQNGVFAYAYGASARRICTVRGWTPKNTVCIDAATMEMTTKLLTQRGWSVVESSIG